MPYLLKTFGVVDNGLDFAGAFNHAFGFENTAYILSGVSGNFVEIKPVKAGAKNMTLVNHHVPV